MDSYLICQLQANDFFNNVKILLRWNKFLIFNLSMNKSAGGGASYFKFYDN